MPTDWKTRASRVAEADAEGETAFELRLRRAKPKRATLVTPLAARDRVGVPRDERRAERRSGQKLANLPPRVLARGTPARSEGATRVGAKGRSAMRTVALDLGVRKISYCEVADGEVLERGTVSQLGALERLLGPECPPARVAIEACREAWFIHDRLTEWGNEVLVLDTTRTKQIGVGQHGRKTDRIDAEMLARALERGGVSLAHLLSPHRRQLRTELGTRRSLVEARASMVVVVRGILRERGLRLPQCDTENFVKHARGANFEPAIRQCIEPLLVTLETIGAQLAVVDERLAGLCRQEPVIDLLSTVPGVGMVVAAGFVSVVDDAKRFRDAHQLESYIGLVPNESTTGGRQRLGGITKHGNPYLRSLLVQSAWRVLRQKDETDPLRVWGLAVAERRGMKIAIVAVARRLVGILWGIWRRNLPYDKNRLASASSRGFDRAADKLRAQAVAVAAPPAATTRRRRSPGARTEVASAT